MSHGPNRSITWLAATVPVLALAVFAASAFALSKVDMVTVRLADNGREIRVAPGGLVLVELEQAGAAGYAWEIQAPDGEFFEVAKTETVSKPPAGDAVGGPVLVQWTIRAKKSGTSELRFLHYRPWEGKQSAIATFTVRVRIQ